MEEEKVRKSWTEEPPPDEGMRRLRQEERPSRQGAAAMLAYAKVQADEILGSPAGEGTAAGGDGSRPGGGRGRGRRPGRRLPPGLRRGTHQAQGERARQEEELRARPEQIRVFLERASAAREELMEQTREELCDLSLR